MQPNNMCSKYDYVALGKSRANLYCTHVEDREDFAQECAISAWKADLLWREKKGASLDHFRFVRSTWEAWRQSFRAKRYYARYEIDSFDPDQSNAFNLCTYDPFCSFEAKIIVKQLLERVRLSREDKSILNYYFGEEELSYREIGKKLGKSHVFVYDRLDKMLKLLRKEVNLCL